MGDEALDWSPAMLSSAKGRIEVRRRANLDQLIVLQGRHRGLVEALASLREAHAASTRTEAKVADPEGAGLAAACKQVHELAVASHADVLTQAGSVRENDGLLEALDAMGTQAAERRTQAAQAAAGEAARAEADREADPAPQAPEPLPEAAAPPLAAPEPPEAAPEPEPAAVAEPGVALPARPRGMHAGMTVGQAIAAEERRARLSGLARLMGSA